MDSGGHTYLPGGLENPPGRRGVRGPSPGKFVKIKRLEITFYTILALKNEKQIRQLFLTNFTIGAKNVF
jgi:hypothetical protein